MSNKIQQVTTLYILTALLDDIDGAFFKFYVLFSSFIWKLCTGTVVFTCG